MRTKFLRVAIVFVLLACFICPILEMQDRWDYTLKTGQDTESAVVVLAVCVGAIISFAVSAATLDEPSCSGEKQTYASFVIALDLPIISREFAAVSQPPPQLRI